MSITRIFISYRHSKPDEDVATAVFNALSQQPEYEVFIDQTMGVGTEWAKRIEQELRRSDYLISFLSGQAVLSEMVLAEIETAHQLGKQYGKPHILPVRLAYNEPFVYPLSAYLNPINWASWNSDDDTPKLIEQLQKAISEGRLTEDPIVREVASPASATIPPPSASAQPPPKLETVEGTMRADSKFYIEREEDATALWLVQQNADQGATLTIKGPRQMGKSSMLMRVIEAARQNDKQTILIDFQPFDKAAFTNADTFFFQFATLVTDELDLESKLPEYWNMPLSVGHRCTRYFERYVLKELEKPLVLAMDEVESVFDTDFRAEFFSMLRTWHNNRASKPIWNKLSLALVTSTEPYQFIDNLNMSPFNVGVNLDLTDFTSTQVAKLNDLHGSPLTGSQAELLLELLHGHPYLTRKALFAIAVQKVPVETLLNQGSPNIDANGGPFGDHLRHHLFRLQDKEDLIKGMRQVINQNVCYDEAVFFRLQSAGLIRRDGNTVLPHCKLYGEYFKRHLNV